MHPPCNCRGCIGELKPHVAETHTTAPTMADLEEPRMTTPPNRGEPLPLDAFLDRKEASKILGVKPATMADWAVRGFGPPMVKFGRIVKYDLKKLMEWAESRTVTSTATFGRGA